MENTTNIRSELPHLLKRHNVQSLVDIPCGDFNWMRSILAESSNIRSYKWFDIVEELIKNNRSDNRDSRVIFSVLDITREVPPQADLLIVRDLFIHLSFRDTFRAIHQIARSNARLLLTTTYTGVEHNRDIVTGRWRFINLMLPPYNFHAPIEMIRENDSNGKSLGLWRLADIQGSYVLPKLRL